jgi:uncharacterized protein (TIGR02118 family)
MVKLVILFHKAAGADTFEDGYNAFLHLVEQMPHIQRRQVNTVLGSPLGETSLYRALELYFEDYDTLNRALNSPVGQTAGGELARRFTTGTYELYFADVYEESGAQTEGSF